MQGSCSAENFLDPGGSSANHKARYAISLIYQSIVAAVAILVAAGANIYGIKVRILCMLPLAHI